MTFHHIVSDGWSMSVLTREVAALYRHSCEGDLVAAEASGQYADYALWQRGWLEGARILADSLAYWRDRLAGAPAALELPTDRPRPAVAAFTKRRLWIAIPKALSEGLAQVARSQGATLYMVLLAAFQTVLSRWSGQDDVVVGSPIAGRTRRRAGRSDRVLRQHLVLRTDLSGDPSFVELLERVKRDGVGGLRPPGPSVREAGGGTAARARPQPPAALPGDAGAAELPRSRLALPRSEASSCCPLRRATLSST